MEIQQANEFWQQRWQSGSTPWDHGVAAPPFAEWLDAHGAAVSRGRMLVPGCGSGHDARLFAANGWQVTGLDIAAEAVERATHAHPPTNLRFCLGDWLQPQTWLDQPYDWVLEHTCLCALPPALWSCYRDSLRAVLRPGGYYLAIFYVRTREPGGPPHQIDSPVIDQLFGADFTLRQRHQPTRAFESRVGREELRLYQKR